MSALDPELRALLVCPACRGELEDREDGLACPRCALLYPIEEGVPFLVRECAVPLSPPAEPGP
jgi:uncharacterized protein YbaR (Trm112 family)